MTKRLTAPQLLSAMARRSPRAKPKVIKDSSTVPYTSLRLYTFCNYYLSSIQQGIQSAHVVSELFTKYVCEENLLWAWGRKHKTMIVCNGGMGSDLEDGFAALINLESIYPITGFREEPSAFMTAGSQVLQPMTAFGIILPNTVYEAMPVYSLANSSRRRTGAWEHGVKGVDYVKWSAGTPEAVIMDYVSTKPLAR